MFNLVNVAVAFVGLFAITGYSILCAWMGIAMEEKTGNTGVAVCAVLFCMVGLPALIAFGFLPPILH